MTDWFDGDYQDLLLDDATFEAMVEADTGIHLPRGYLSYSQINLYLLCPKRYEFENLKPNERQNASTPTQGRLVHKGIEAMVSHKMLYKAVPPRELHRDVVSALLSVEFADVDVWDEKVPDIETAENLTRALLDLYYDKRLPSVNARAVEYRVTARLRGRIPFLGFIDLVEKSPMDLDDGDLSPDPRPGDRIIDNKATGRAYPAGRIENSLQLSLYAHAAGVDLVGYDLLVSTKLPKFVEQRADRAPSELEHALDIVEDVAQGISAGYFPRTDPDSWMCSSKWCPFWKQCRGK